MKNHLMHLESPFLNESIPAPEPAHEREFVGAAPALEAGDDAVDELDEAERCGADGEAADLEAEWFDHEEWSGTAEQAAFRDRVLAAHLARSGKRGKPGRDLAGGELDDVKGTKIKMGAAAAAAASDLLAAANAALAVAQQAGNDDALRTIRLSATSGYRASDHQRRLWLEYFPGYYKRTRAARERLTAGAHSDDAVAYMLRTKGDGGFGLGGRIAAPGYSNHQNGIAIDLWQERKKGHYIANDSGDGPRAKWRATWFHGWLLENAAGFGFKPLATEEWHWEHRTAATKTAPTPANSGAVVGAVGKPGADVTRFAQLVLNAVEGERLSSDGDLGAKTRAALERFRQKHGLGAGGVLDAATELALAQRAIEELAQASMFAQPGKRDARTDQELIRFKTGRGLGTDAKLDAATRAALADAVTARSKRVPKGNTAPPPPRAATTTPVSHLGGKVWTFQARVVPTPVAVFVPPAAAGQGEVDVLVFAHGLLHGCPKPRSVPDGIVTSAPFQLGAVVAKAQRPTVLVVPLLDWNSPGSARAFGKSWPRWHELAKPAHLNALVAEVLAELARVQGAAAPSLRRLVVGGHSRAYDFLEPLAALHRDPEVRTGALGKLAEVWSFDATYAGSVKNWQAWLAADPLLRVSVFYRPVSGTKAVGDAFFAAAGGRLSVTKVTETHCVVPGKRLATLLAGDANAQAGEVTDEWHTEEIDADEVVDGESAAIAYEADVPETNARELEYEGETVADDFAADEHECCGRHRETDADDELDGADELGELEELDELEGLAAQLESEGALDEAGDDEAGDDEAGEFEDEEDAELALEEHEDDDKAPRPVPPGAPVPFAPEPPAGSFWPVRTKHANGREVAYRTSAGKVIGTSGSGRMFLADRRTKRGGPVNRWHVGIDVWAYKHDIVVACEAGTIVEFGYFYTAKSGERTHFLLMEHDSGVVANYGEVTADSLSSNGLTKGMRVSAGQVIGKVSSTSMLHFETYVKGTKQSHRWMKADSQPKALLNPTRYLLHLAKHGEPSGGARTTPPPAPKPVPKPVPKPTPTAGASELVRFAQRVLNAVESERLATDGKLGNLTRAALERFRKRHALGAGGAIDQATTLALAQRALEELAQQSMFAQPGTNDARTREEMTAFRSKHGLGAGATLDAATRAALTDALARRTTGTPAPAPKPAPKPAPTNTGPLPTIPNLGAGRTPPANAAAYRKFRLTTYHVVDQKDEPTGAVRVPIYGDKGNKIAEGSPSFFAKLSLEGTGRLTDGRLVNVTGKKIAVRHDEYAEVLATHQRAYARADANRKKQGQSPTPTQYSGIEVAGGRVVRAFAFHEVPAAKTGVGYGMARDVPYTPFRTLAADIGHTGYSRVEPRWKGKGGLVPPKTRVYIKEYDGLRLPDGTTHDGWFVVNDTGGAIFGAHFDVFTGTDALRQKLKLPAFGQVWFDGIEDRIPAGYTYGLTK